MKVNTKRKICGIITITCFFLLYGLIGGVERDYITITEFLWRGFILSAIGGFAFYKSGYWK